MTKPSRKRTRNQAEAALTTTNATTTTTKSTATTLSLVEQPLGLHRQRNTTTTRRMSSSCWVAVCTLLAVAAPLGVTTGFTYPQQSNPYQSHVGVSLYFAVVSEDDAAAAQVVTSEVDIATLTRPQQHSSQKEEEDTSTSSIESKFPVMPPWLQQRKRQNQSQHRQGRSSSPLGDEEILSATHHTSTTNMIQSEIQSLEYTLREHHGLTQQDVSTVVKAIYLCSSSGGGDTQQLILGSIDFLKLLIGLEATTLEDSQSRSSRGEASSSSITKKKKTKKKKNVLVTKDVLLASVLHYTECATARMDGIYEKVQNAYFQQLPADKPASSEYSIDASLSLLLEDDDQQPQQQEAIVVGDGPFATGAATSLRSKLTTAADKRAKSPSRHHVGGFDFFTPEALHLAAGASQIKRAEILAGVVLMQNRALTRDEYASVRDLLVSVMDDWRALAIRCVASLYRLEGVLLHQEEQQESVVTTTTTRKKRSFAVTLAARNSIRVYANLAQRIGLHRLKSQLEAGAFKVLYPRQYNAVSSLFDQKGLQMQYIAAYLTDQIQQMLHNDPVIVEQLDDDNKGLVVSSRVKEPFSFWKKILKKRHNTNKGLFLSPGSKISVIDVHDGVALRVILKAKKMTSDESDETTRRREAMLCYYVHHLIRSRWPAIDESRVKDYIKHPKANGYQSLHHTSKIVRNHQEFPFEVQVRSEEMHRIAEYGVAAHFDYKVEYGTDNDKAAALLAPTTSKSILANAGELQPISKSAATTTGKNNKNSKYIDALETARHALVQSNVYVFFGESSSIPGTGQLLTLPRGAQIADLLEELAQDDDDDELYASNTLQVWKNGQRALLNDVVGNGDVVVVLSPVTALASAAAADTTNDDPWLNGVLPKSNGLLPKSNSGLPRLPPVASTVVLETIS